MSNCRNNSKINSNSSDLYSTNSRVNVLPSFLTPLRSSFRDSSASLIQSISEINYVHDLAEKVPKRADIVNGKIEVGISYSGFIDAVLSTRRDLDILHTSGILTNVAHHLSGTKRRIVDIECGTVGLSGTRNSKSECSCAQFGLLTKICQPLWECHSCNMSCICESCANSCHDSHFLVKMEDIDPRFRSSCSCGSGAQCQLFFVAPDGSLSSSSRSKQAEELAVVMEYMLLAEHSEVLGLVLDRESDPSGQIPVSTLIQMSSALISAIRNSGNVNGGISSPDSKSIGVFAASKALVSSSEVFTFRKLWSSRVQVSTRHPLASTVVRRASHFVDPFSQISHWDSNNTSCEICSSYSCDRVVNSAVLLALANERVIGPQGERKVSPMASIPRDMNVLEFISSKFSTDYYSKLSPGFSTLSGGLTDINAVKYILRHLANKKTTESREESQDAEEFTRSRVSNFILPMLIPSLRNHSSFSSDKRYYTSKSGTMEVNIINVRRSSDFSASNFQLLVNEISDSHHGFLVVHVELDKESIEDVPMPLRMVILWNNEVMSIDLKSLEVELCNTFSTQFSEAEYRFQLNEGRKRLLDALKFIFIDDKIIKATFNGLKMMQALQKYYDIHFCSHLDLNIILHQLAHKVEMLSAPSALNSVDSIEEDNDTCISLVAPTIDQQSRDEKIHGSDFSALNVDESNFPDKDLNIKTTLISSNLNALCSLLIGEFYQFVEPDSLSGGFSGEYDLVRDSLVISILIIAIIKVSLPSLGLLSEHINNSNPLEEHASLSISLHLNHLMSQGMTGGIWDHHLVKSLMISQLMCIKSYHHDWYHSSIDLESSLMIPPWFLSCRSCNSFGHYYDFHFQSN